MPSVLKTGDHAALTGNSRRCHAQALRSVTRGRNLHSTLRFAGAVAALLLGVTAAGAQDAAPPAGVLVYDEAYFADARPNTAMDMINRLPGFAFDDGDTARGFAGTAGNVLIDGQR